MVTPPPRSLCTSARASSAPDVSSAWASSSTAGSAPRCSSARSGSRRAPEGREWRATSFPRRGVIVPKATVRWFDPDKGFGFLALGEDSEDLFVHASEIQGGAEPKVLREGQEVEFELGEGDRGPIATRVRVTGAHGPSGSLGVLGTVSWYEPTKGYGFASPEGGGPEIFVHSSAIVGGAVVSEGQRVAFLIVDGEKGPQADHLIALRSDAGGAGAGAAAADGADG